MMSGYGISRLSVGVLGSRGLDGLLRVGAHFIERLRLVFGVQLAGISSVFSSAR